jgi:hypothetical protein
MASDTHFLDFCTFWSSGTAAGACSISSLATRPRRGSVDFLRSGLWNKESGGSLTEVQWSIDLVNLIVGQSTSEQWQP